MADCSSIQRSLAWCQGKPELPGVKRRVYYISKYDILQWPSLPHDANGRLSAASYSGNFILRADVKWKYIDILPDKSQLTSEPQGDYPSQTQLNKLVAVHPGVDLDASGASAYLNNNDNVFLVEDMRGAFRVVGSDKWLTKTTVTQDLGQGATGSASTTINVEASDECPAPFYSGVIETEEGTTSGTNTGGNTGGNSGSGGGQVSKFNNEVIINGTPTTVSNGETINTFAPLTSIKITGSNIDYVSVSWDGNEEEASVNETGTTAQWNGNIPGEKIVGVHRGNGNVNNLDIELWFKISVIPQPNIPT